GDNATDFLSGREGEALGEGGAGGGRELAKVVESPGRLVVEGAEELVGTVCGETKLGEDGVEFGREHVIERREVRDGSHPRVTSGTSRPRSPAKNWAPVIRLPPGRWTSSRASQASSKRTAGTPE